MSGLVCANGFRNMQCGTGIGMPLGIYHMRATTLIGVLTGPVGRSSPPHQGGRGEGVRTVMLCWFRSIKETPMSDLFLVRDTTPACSWHGWPSLSGHPLCICCRSAVSLFSTDIGERRLGPDIPVRDQP